MVTWQQNSTTDRTDRLRTRSMYEVLDCTGAYEPRW